MVPDMVGCEARRQATRTQARLLVLHDCKDAVALLQACHASAPCMQRANVPVGASKTRWQALVAHDLHTQSIIHPKRQVLFGLGSGHLGESWAVCLVNR